MGHRQYFVNITQDEFVVLEPIRLDCRAQPNIRISPGWDIPKVIQCFGE
jgi:hypothetical protein